MKPKRKHKCTVLVCKLCDASLETWQLDLLVAAFYIPLQSSRLFAEERKLQIWYIWNILKLGGSSSNWSADFQFSNVSSTF